jgi:hypothetical protein
MNDLIEAIRAKRALLFVGAGVSANLGIPSWSELSSQMATQLGLDPEEYRKLGDDQTLAEYFALKSGSLDALTRWMDQKWHRGAASKVRRSRIHRLIVDLGFPVIYTTNYDRYLELAHEAQGRPCTTVTTIAELANASAVHPQIVKLHGDLKNSPMVLTESSHFERLTLDSALDLKLQADLLSRTTLFIGYSVSDISIRYLLFRLHKLWLNAPSHAVRPGAYVFLGQRNIVQETVLASWGITPLVSGADHAGQGLQGLLSDLIRQRDTKTRRRAKRKTPKPMLANHQTTEKRRASKDEQYEHFPVRVMQSRRQQSAR